MDMATADARKFWLLRTPEKFGARKAWSNLRERTHISDFWSFLQNLKKKIFLLKEQQVIKYFESNWNYTGTFCHRKIIWKCQIITMQRAFSWRSFWSAHPTRWHHLSTHAVISTTTLSRILNSLEAINRPWVRSKWPIKKQCSVSMTEDSLQRSIMFWKALRLKLPVSTGFDIRNRESRARWFRNH